MVKRSERNTGTKCWVRRIVWKAGVGRAEVEASVIVMERMWRERKEEGEAINFGARSVAHMCAGYAFGKSEELQLSDYSWIGEKNCSLPPLYACPIAKICQEKKEGNIYICVCVCACVHIYICIKRSRFKIISLTCFTIFNYFRVVNARWIPD